CLANVPPLPNVTATDNCDTNVSLILVCTTNGSCPLVINCTWTATDDCANTSTATRTITVQDTLAPVLLGVPASQSYQCLANVPPLPNVTATDNCDTNVSLTLVCTTNGICPLVIHCTWTATDDCSNQSSATFIVTVQDTIAPVLAGLPTNRTYQCLAEMAPLPAVSATDNCDTNVSITLVCTTNGPCPLFITCRWTATDDCGNASGAIRTFSVHDTLPPLLSAVPANRLFQCIGDVPPPAVLSATDNCDTNVIVTRSSITNGPCPTIVDSWTAMA